MVGEGLKLEKGGWGKITDQFYIYTREPSLLIHCRLTKLDETYNNPKMPN